MKTTNLTFVNNSNNQKPITPLTEKQYELFKVYTEKINSFRIFFTVDNKKVYGVRMPKANVEERLTVYHDMIVMMLPLSKKQMTDLINDGTATYYCELEQLKTIIPQLPKEKQNYGFAIEYFLEQEKGWKLNHERALKDGGDGHGYDIKFFRHGSTKHDRVIERISEKM